MKKVLLCSILVMLAVSISTAIPQTVNLQGNLTNSSGDVVADGNYNITVSLYDSEFAAIGTHVWQDTFNVSIKRGNFAIQLGSGVVSLTGLDFNNAYWAGIQVGTATEMTTRLPLQSVPYALQAQMADNVTDNAITSVKVADASISKADLASNSVDSSKIENLAVDTDDIANSAISSAKVANNAIDTQAKAPWAPRVNVDSNWVNNPIIACGSITTGVSGEGYAFLGYEQFGFTNEPKIVVTAKEKVGADKIFIITDENRHIKGLGIRTIDAATGNSVNVEVDWMMIGY